MKILHVAGEDDYSVVDFNKLGISIKDAWDKAFHSEDGSWHFKQDGWASALTFTGVTITQEFLDFVKTSLGDKEMLKAEDFFIVE